MVIKFEDMTQEQKSEAFEKWMSGRDARKGKSKARREATQALVKKYADEYAKYLKVETAKLGK